jgi:hypothetical protein
MDTFWKLINQTARVDPPGRRAVHHQVVTALSTGWTALGLAEWIIRQLRAAGNRGPISNRGGFVVSRLKEIPPPTDDAASKPGPPASLPACDLCGAAEGAPLARRMTIASDGRLRRCDCRGTPATGTPTDRRDRTRDAVDDPTQVTDPMTELDLTAQLRSGPDDPGDEQHVHHRHTR